MIVATALAGAAVQSARAEWCSTVGFSRPDVVVFENEATNVDISLIDNGLLDGFRDFRNGSFWVRIEDNEIGSALDPLFVSDRAAGQFYGYNYKYVAAAMPDGRILLPGSRELTMLHSDGRVDLGFATKLTDQFTSLRDVQVLSDGRILVAGHDYELHPAPRLVRLLPSGALDTIFTIPNFSGTAIGQPDGKVLAVSIDANNKTTLRRFNTDGSPDAGFVSSAVVDGADPLALQSDGKILVGKYGPGSVLVRLNPDGLPDNSFASVLSDGKVDSLLLRANGKLIITGDFSVDGTNRMALAQLNEDGGLDATFKLDPALHIGWSHSDYSTPILEQADGGLVAGGMDVNGYGVVMQWNADGTHAKNLATFKGLDGYCSYSGLTLALTQDGQILVGGNILSVDGFRCRGLARLLTSPPERDFRVVTPAEFHGSSGVARIRVVRTGSTTNPASVSFTTRDDTARAGEDYVAQSGTLNFAPFEVSKEVTVPLLARIGIDERRWFNLELSNPSAGYTNIPSTPIAILADLRIATDSLQPRADGSITIMLHGTVLGRWYGLETSADLKNWGGITGRNASGSTLVFDSFLPKTSPQFFRARSD